MPLCSHPALRTVHQRSYWNTGMPPLAPNRNRLVVLGARNENRPFILMPLPDMSSIATYRPVDPHMTSGTNPRSLPSFRSSGPKPHNPGFRRPQL